MKNKYTIPHHTIVTWCDVNYVDSLSTLARTSCCSTTTPHRSRLWFGWCVTTCRYTMTLAVRSNITSSWYVCSLTAPRERMSSQRSIVTPSCLSMTLWRSSRTPTAPLRYANLMIIIIILMIIIFFCASLKSYYPYSYTGTIKSEYRWDIRNDTSAQILFARAQQLYKVSTQKLVGILVQYTSINLRFSSHTMSIYNNLSFKFRKYLSHMSITRKVNTMTCHHNHMPVYCQ